MPSITPRASVIVPAYNAGEYVTEALESALAQTFQGIEIVAVDDGSTDNTLEILRRYEPRVVVRTKPNDGPASAKNVGIQNSSAEYIAFLDADDVWLGDTLQHQVEFMENNPEVGFAYGDALCFYSEDSTKSRSHLLSSDLQGLVFRELFWSCFIPNSTVIVRRECLERTGWFDESPGVLGSEDYDLWLRLALRFPLGHIPQVLAKYRLHSQNLIGNSYEKAFPLHLNIYKKFFRMFPEIKGELASNKNQCIGDLCIRYAYRNLLEEDFARASRKSILAIPHTPARAISALSLIVARNYDRDCWAKIIPDLDLWHRIVSNEW